MRYRLDRFNDEDPEFVRTMNNSFYVDGLVNGQQNEAQANEPFWKSCHRLAERGFKLRK